MRNKNSDNASFIYLYKHNNYGIDTYMQICCKICTQISHRHDSTVIGVIQLSLAWFNGHWRDSTVIGVIQLSYLSKIVTNKSHIIMPSNGNILCVTWRGMGSDVRKAWRWLLLHCYGEWDIRRHVILSLGLQCNSGMCRRRSVTDRWYITNWDGVVAKGTDVQNELSGIWGRCVTEYVVVRRRDVTYVGEVCDSGSQGFLHDALGIRRRVNRENDLPSGEWRSQEHAGRDGRWRRDDFSWRHVTLRTELASSHAHGVHHQNEEEADDNRREDHLHQVKSYRRHLKRSIKNITL